MAKVIKQLSFVARSLMFSQNALFLLALAIALKHASVFFGMMRLVHNVDAFCGSELTILNAWLITAVLSWTGPQSSGQTTLFSSGSHSPLPQPGMRLWTHSPRTHRSSVAGFKSSHPPGHSCSSVISETFSSTGASEIFSSTTSSTGAFASCTLNLAVCVLVILSNLAVATISYSPGLIVSDSGILFVDTALSPTFSWSVLVVMVCFEKNSRMV